MARLNLVAPLNVKDGMCHGRPGRANWKTLSDRTRNTAGTAVARLNLVAPLNVKDGTCHGRLGRANWKTLSDRTRNTAGTAVARGLPKS